MRAWFEMEWRMSKRPMPVDRFEPDELLLALGARIKRERRRRQLTQGDLGAKAGTHQSTISAVEAGDGDIRVGTLMKIAQAMELTIADLLPGLAKRPRAPEGSAGALAELVERLGTITRELKDVEQRVIVLRNAATDSEEAEGDEGADEG